MAATLNTANAILLEGYISFLGYGIQPPEASWGNMLTNAQSDFQVDAWLAVFPGLAITLAVASFNFIGDGLRDALDPRMRDDRRPHAALLDVEDLSVAFGGPARSTASRSRSRQARRSAWSARAAAENRRRRWR